MTCLVDGRKGMGVVLTVNFGEVFDTISHIILLEKLAVCGVD